MKKGSHRIMGQKELAKRQFKKEKTELEKKADKYGIDIYSNESVIPTTNYICVVSFNEYELGEPASNCDLTSESYYVKTYDYETFFEED